MRRKIPYCERKDSIYRHRYNNIEAYRKYQREYQREYYKNNPEQKQKHKELTDKSRMKTYWKRKKNKTEYALYLKQRREYQRRRISEMKINEPEKYAKIMARTAELQRQRYWNRKWKKQYRD